MQFYFDSGLGSIEVSRYLNYVEMNKNKKILHSPDKNKVSKSTVSRYYFEMIKDSTFMHKLLTEQIITVEDEMYGEWRGLRDEFADLLSKVTSMKYGYIPSSPRYLNAITCMFLHGGVMHLVGNMVFLWLVGCVLELGCGRVFYTGLYLLTGVASVGLFQLIYPDSVLPLIGASGAISGLIGAYTLLYGKKKIKIFYSLGIYFNYTKIYAIALLPVWIGKEFFQLFFGGSSQVAYVAHIGGLVSGALLGVVNLKLLGRVDQEVFKEDPKEGIDALLETALQKIAKLDLSGARPVLEHILEKDPHNTDALYHLFNIDKLNPQSETFHKTASRALLGLSTNKENKQRLHDVYKEYADIAKPLRLHPDLLFRISSLFSAMGHPEEAEKIMAMLLQKHPTSQKIPSGILNLGRAYLKKGMSAKGQKCLRVLCKRYPESSESQIALRLLQPLK
ncbi:MAG: rhomboid family intramembrane serine protease [Deltaproteobacteria bacterium]|nr:rhomboid family intramembrane serine protease [Deltaproteobacteria bacterium]